jgi:hypothetical protein
VKARALRALGLFLRAARTAVVAIVCLLIGFSARHLFDAYAGELIRFLLPADPEAEVHLTVTPPPPFPTEGTSGHFLIE